MRAWTIVCAAILVALGGCGGDGPVDIDVSADSCSRCRMSIDQLAHAGEIITASGEVKKYDSLGCLAEDYRRQTGAGPRARGAFVVDYRTHRWVEASAAHYALASLPTDHMGYGIAALASREQALELVGGASEKVVTWDQLLLRAARGDTR